MENHNSFVLDDKGRYVVGWIYYMCFSEVSKPVRGLTSADLEKLNHVRIITDYLEVQAGSNSPVSLAFLRNLAVIEGRRLSK